VALIVDYLAAKSGGPVPYRERDMKLSHAGMKIDELDWQALMKHLNATPDHFKAPEKEPLEVIAFAEIH
jgi:hemoglobin